MLSYSFALNHVVDPMLHSFKLTLSHEQDTQKLAETLAKQLNQGVIYLIGDLGAGKTTLTRYLLRSLGHQGAVKSPTYTLVEPYKINGKEIFHFDLYRLNDPYELELMGIRDYLDIPNALFLFEWPSKGGDEIPQADYVIEIEKSTDDTNQEHVRFVTIHSNSLEFIQALQH